MIGERVLEREREREKALRNTIFYHRYENDFPFLNKYSN